MIQTDVLVIGELLADIISNDYVGDLSEARHFQLFPGGSPANVCANLRWMGLRTRLVSCIGQDGIGDYILDTLRRLGLDDAFITRSDRYPTSLVLVGRSRSTPDFIAYRMADTQIGHIDEALISESRILHSGAFALSRNPAQQHILAAFARAQAMGKVISIDWNYAPRVWRDDGKAIFEQLCRYKPLLKMSLDDVERFVGQTLSIEDARAFLERLPVAVACLTCGRDGVWYKSGDDALWQFEPAQAVAEVKDTTGAGDAFWSGFLLAYLRADDLTGCVQEGIRMATRKIQQVGPLYTT